MSTTEEQTQTTPTSPVAPKSGRSGDAREMAITGGRLKKFTWVGMLVLSVLVAGGILAVLGSFSLPATLALGALVFLGSMFALSAAVEGIRPAKDRLVQYLVTTFFLLVLLPLGSLVYEVLTRGLARFDWRFFTETQAQTHVLEATLGAQHAIVGSLLITGLAVLISVPIGIFAAIYLVEYGATSRLAFGIRFFVDVMTGIPSIVAGLFAYTMFSILLGPGSRTGLAGAVALSVLMIPTVVRSTEEMLKLVPNELREASYALGVPKWRTIVRVVLPTSLAGIVTGIVLGIARIIGETAPLLVTAGYYLRMNTNPFEGPLSTLPVLVYQSLRIHGPRADDLHALGWTGALVLILIVMALNLIGRFIALKYAPKPGR